MDRSTAYKSLTAAAIATMAAISFSAAGATINTLFAAEAQHCIDYACNDDAECESVDCDVCHTDERCGLEIP